MSLRSPGEYVASLRDGREVYFRGQRVEDVTTHSIIGTAVRHASIDYQMADDPKYRDLAVVEDEGRTYSRYYKLPRDADDLLKRSALIEAATREGRTLVVLVKEIGTDALFSLQVLAHHLGGEYPDRVRAFYEHCRDQDLALAVAQTDPKGDRSKSPSDQAHPDYYLRRVERVAGGILVRGAKLHTSVTPNANELIVLPTRAMGADDADYALAFAIPVNTPGLKLICSPYGSRKGNTFENPLSAEHKMMETLTIFDDVFVPDERIFLDGQAKLAGPLALGFVEFHRFTAISYKLPLVDLLVGSALLMAEYNGIERAGHVRDKITQLIAYAETLRALAHAAARACKIMPPGIAVPDPLIVNMAKYHFAHNYHHALALVQDVTGGLAVTGPALEDLESPELGEYVRRYLGGRAGVAPEDRLRAINMVSDLTAADFGGYHAVLAIHAEGSIEAEKLAVLRSYDAERARQLAREMAGIGQ